MSFLLVATVVALTDVVVAVDVVDGFEVGADDQWVLLESLLFSAVGADRRFSGLLHHYNNHSDGRPVAVAADGDAEDSAVVFVVVAVEVVVAIVGSAEDFWAQNAVLFLTIESI